MISLELNKKQRFTIWFLGIIFLFFCFGCQEGLYTNLPEQDINDMLAVLLRNGIDCKKVNGDESAWSLHVDSGEIAKAVEILNRNGFPRNHFETMGEVFKKEGFISSPLEERIRFIHALSSEVSATISKIEGVIFAKVHIVIPENDPLSDNFLPSSASVFIKHRSDHQLDSQVLKIKELVVNSIEGLEYKNVTLAMFPVESGTKSGKSHKNYVELMGLELSPDSAPAFKTVMLMVAGLLVGAGAGSVLLLRQNNRLKVAVKQQGGQDVVNNQSEGQAASGTQEQMDAKDANAFKI